MRILAIDQGTSSTRAFVLEQNGHGKIICSREHRQYYPEAGRVEHDPEQLLSHIIECIDSAGQVDAMGIDNQGESCLAWDSSTGKAISPVIVWQDRRSEPMLNTLREQGAEALTLERAGLPLDSYFSAGKLGWILKHIPQAKLLLAQGRLHLGTTDAFFIERLTGHYVTDIATASRTSLLNLQTGQWDPDLCTLFSIPIEALPVIQPGISHFGTVRTTHGDIPLTASTVDQQAALYGHGCRHAGDAKITFGTGAFALALTGNELFRAPHSGLLPTIAWQSKQQPVYALDGAVYCAGSALNWAKSLRLFTHFSDINQFDSPPAIEQNLVFVPALTGLASPYWDGSAAGMWLGMSLDTRPAQLVQAILEGIAFRTGQVIKAMAKQIELGDNISIDGGLSSNPYFCQFLADVLQKQIQVQRSTELTAQGIAMMAGANLAINIEQKIEHCYTPENNREEGANIFSQAVERSRNWHKPITN